MKRIHFDGKGPVPWHYFFWEPWGCGGCLWRGILFVVLLSLLLFLLSQFRSCTNSDTSAGNAGEPVADTTVPPVRDVVPPINDDDVIEEDGRQVVCNRLNVLFGAECGQAEYESWCSQFEQQCPPPDYAVLFYDPNTKLMQIQVPEDRRVALITELPEMIPDIPFMVFGEDVMEPVYRPNDPVFGNTDHSWYFDMVKAQGAWDITMGSPRTVVAVIDSYFDLDNVDFDGIPIVHPYSVARGDSIVTVPDGFDPQHPDMTVAHGTMVAGFVLGKADNRLASAGIASKCSLMPISLGSRFGSLAMLQGVLFAVNHGASVINFSAGSCFTEAIHELPVEQQIEMAQSMLIDQQTVWQYVYDMCTRNYITIVWAAGNEDVFTALDSSKRGDSTIKVSAVDRNMSKAEFSNFGNFADRGIFESTVSAPGVQVPGLMAHTRGYALVDGTSFSAPIVAGGVALIKSMNPLLTTQQISEILKETGRPVRGSTTIGPVVQFGPALAKVVDGLVPYTDFKSRISAGTSGDMAIARLFVKTLQDSTALPPRCILTIKPSGAKRGKIQFEINGLHPASGEGDYTATVTADAITFNVGAVSVDSISETYEPFTFKVTNGNQNLAYASDLNASWFSSQYPFESFIQKP